MVSMVGILGLVYFTVGIFLMVAESFKNIGDFDPDRDFFIFFLWPLYLVKEGDSK